MRRILSIFLLVIVVMVVSSLIFFYTSPEFGNTPKGKDLERISRSEHYVNGKFINPIKTKLVSGREMLPIAYDYFFKGKNRVPESLLPQKSISINDLELHNDSNIYLRWFGHSTFYIEIDGIRIMLDPMLGKVASPLPFGASRFNRKLPIEIEDLPFIDAVIYSHDHYDHLDYPSVVQLKEKVGHWYTALGMGSHLKSWGIPEERITELDWWQSTTFKGLTFVATPARHFSGRAFTDQFKTFWNSWVIKNNDRSIYFSGDGGYFGGFKEIGEKYGPFDLCLIECGAYNEAWKNIHMMPEESVRACLDLKGKRMMPIHWGAFSLALHEWTDPIIRVSKKAEELGLELVTPVIGEEVVIPSHLPHDQWWNQ